jgi:hypothetical protein
VEIINEVLKLWVGNAWGGKHIVRPTHVVHANPGLTYCDVVGVQALHAEVVDRRSLTRLGDRDDLDLAALRINQTITRLQIPDRDPAPCLDITWFFQLTPEIRKSPCVHEYVERAEVRWPGFYFRGPYRIALIADLDDLLGLPNSASQHSPLVTPRTFRMTNHDDG